MAEYIEREALYKWVLEFYPNDLKFASAVLNAPATKVAEVRHGRWDRNHNCSVCGVYKFKGLDADVWADWNIDYCPNCGAKMDLEV